jgi:hypothetical protein
LVVRGNNGVVEVQHYVLLCCSNRGESIRNFQCYVRL